LESSGEGVKSLTEAGSAGQYWGKVCQGRGESKQINNYGIHKPCVTLYSHIVIQLYFITLSEYTLVK